MAAGDLQCRAEGRLTPRPTIFALATGAPPTAIAIVRISGAAAFAAARALTRQALPPPRHLALRTVHDPVSGEAIDRPLVAVFPAPASATGDDVVELHLHGGRAVVDAVLVALAAHGLTPAAAGGFTRRAFDNGRLDLGQVEALGDLIGAETAGQRRAALARTGTDLGRHVGRWRTVLTEVRAGLEATLDFAEDEGVAAGLTAAHRRDLAALAGDLAAARDGAVRAAGLRDGVTVALVGPVNAGKSTLLNALARRDVAMVSPIAGTTRDVVDVRVALGGVPVTVVDTAGLRPTEDPLEAEGIARGAARAAAAEIVVAFGPSDHPNAVAVAARSDLSDRGAGWHGGVLHLSGRTRAGVDLLEAELATRVAALIGGEPPLVAHRWQVAALDTALVALAAAGGTEDAVIAADELRRAGTVLERLVGRVSDDELLAQIFARFCIGK